MSVRFVTHRYRPAVGGVVERVERVASAAAAGGRDASVVSADRGGSPRREVVGGVEVLRRRSLAPGGNAHLTPASLLDGRDHDVVHAHNAHALPGILAALGSPGDAFLAFTPHYHGAASSPVASALFNQYKALAGAALLRADVVVAVSDHERSLLEHDFDVDPVVIPHGLDYDEVGAEPLDIRSEYALHVGRLERYKNVGALVRALEHTGLDLVVAGDGPDMARLEELARNLGLWDRVVFAGFVDDGELASLYSGASALAALSAREAFGMTVGEALAHGTPAAVNPHGGLVRWVGTGGVAPVGAVDDPRRVAEALETAAGLEPDRRPLPPWEEVAAEVLNLYP
jgi:glycosyltransferase involved in cell wall biosynthesis